MSNSLNGNNVNNNNSLSRNLQRLIFVFNTMSLQNMGFLDIAPIPFCTAMSHNNTRDHYSPQLPFFIIYHGFVGKLVD